MLILTEKPSVAKEFSSALNCAFSKGAYRNSNTVITNCIGHLFKEETPGHYSSDFPVIPDHWDYRLPEDERLAAQAKFVVTLLKSHSSDTIIIATDADREGEIIARECLMQAGIADFSKIKRFWVSQALTKEVILDGLKNAGPLSDYDILAQQGFARQHADWLVGMNFCRYISDAAKTKLTVGRVQTAILSAVEQRCEAIRNFKSRKYFEHFGIFRPARSGSSVSCKGIYFISDGNTEFPDNSAEVKLKSLIGNPVKLLSKTSERKILNPPPLYNLNEAQKDAFKFFGYSAEKTLRIIQSLYEDLKCVSYPRTPSKVMGRRNIELCKKIADVLTPVQKDSDGNTVSKLRDFMNISIENKRCFNDEKLEAHHALIPLKNLPAQADEEQKNVYCLISERFFQAFLPALEYEKQTFILDVNGCKFKAEEKKNIDGGWKKLSAEWNFLTAKMPKEQDEDSDGNEQVLEDIDWNNVTLCEIETKEKWTKPPAYFNEASILSFMENPKENRHVPVKDENQHKKLAGLGTAATRHTFIPLLLKRNYIAFDKKNIICTDLGSLLLKTVRSSSISALGDIELTTDWEQRLNDNPALYLSEIKNYVRNAVSKKIQIEVPVSSSGIFCPVCGCEVRRGKSNWYCTGYKNGCAFTVWESVAGAALTEKDVLKLCSGGRTGIKHCQNKSGKKFDCHFALDENGKIKFVFQH